MINPTLIAAIASAVAPMICALEQPRTVPPSCGHATADARPLSRIRGNDGSGLTRSAFSQWLRDHPEMVVARTGQGFNLSTTEERQAANDDFAAADRNRNGRVSADELADFLIRVAARSPRS